MLMLFANNTGQFMTGTAIPATLQVSVPTFGRVRQCCLASGVDAAMNDKEIFTCIQLPMEEGIALSRSKDSSHDRFEC